MDGTTQDNLRTVEDVFRDFKSRRAALIKALTTDFQEFYEQCDPEKENLCLFGLPNGQWEVNEPVDHVPSQIPEPTIGINFSRDEMRRNDWLSVVAARSDSWLLAVAFFFGARRFFDKGDRNRLFTKINDLPTLYEIVTGNANKQAKEKPSVSNPSSNKSKSTPKARGSESAKFSNSMQAKDKEKVSAEKNDEEQGENLCAACREYDSDEFWICCDICDKWFHCKCVNITPARAEQIELYKCPCCSNRRARPSSF